MNAPIEIIKKPLYLNKNQISYSIALLLVLTLNIRLQAQIIDEVDEIQLDQENSKSSMWGQIGSQMLPVFHVNNENFEYPDEAMKNRTQGQVDLMFLVNREGSIIDSTVQIINGLSKALDEKAIEIIKKSRLKSYYLPFIKQSYNPNIRYVASLVFAIQEKHWASYYNKIGLKAYNNHNFKEAIRNFNLSIEFDDKNAKSHYYLYRAYSKINQKENACNCIKKAKRLNKGFRNEWKSKCK